MPGLICMQDAQFAHIHEHAYHPILTQQPEEREFSENVCCFVSFYSLWPEESLAHCFVDISTQHKRYPR